MSFLRNDYLRPAIKRQVTATKFPYNNEVTINKLDAPTVIRSSSCKSLLGDKRGPCNKLIIKDKTTSCGTEAAHMQLAFLLLRHAPSF